jgi:hypothetical protein
MGRGRRIGGGERTGRGDFIGRGAFIGAGCDNGRGPRTDPSGGTGFSGRKNGMIFSFTQGSSRGVQDSVRKKALP